jgi:hypothetical protein
MMLRIYVEVDYDMTVHSAATLSGVPSRGSLVLLPA